MTGDSYIIDPTGEVIAGPAVGETLLKAVCDTAGHSSQPDVRQLRINRSPISPVVEMGDHR